MHSVHFEDNIKKIIVTKDFILNKGKPGTIRNETRQTRQEKKKTAKCCFLFNIINNKSNLLEPAEYIG